MSSVYKGKYRDIFLELKLEESIFIKCCNLKERTSLSVAMVTYAKQYKRKFKSKLIGDQLKITRIQ